MIKGRLDQQKNKNKGVSDYDSAISFNKHLIAFERKTLSKVNLVKKYADLFSFFQFGLYHK